MQLLLDIKLLFGCGSSAVGYDATTVGYQASASGSSHGFWWDKQGQALIREGMIEKEKRNAWTWSYFGVSGFPFLSLDPFFLSREDSWCLMK